MAGVKHITMGERTIGERVSKETLKKDHAMSIEIREDDITLEERSEVRKNPNVIHKGSNSELNFEKQYKRRVNHCTGRKPFRIHDFSRPGDHGAVDKSLVYVEFQGGVFEALKINMVSILAKQHNISLCGNTQIETYGASQAQERFCLDMSMNVNDHTHQLKIKVYNTACALDAQGTGDQVHTIFEHLENKTVGEYFANVVMPKVVEFISDKLDIKALNEKYLKLAREGVKLTRKSKINYLCHLQSKFGWICV